MRKTTKGALAASAAGVLLIGGAGTLAYWNDSATINGGSLTAGQLDLVATTCDTDWQLDNSAIGNNGNLGTDEIVPGDTLTKACEYTLTVEGDHFEGELDINAPSAFNWLGAPAVGTPQAELADELDLTTAFTVAGPGLPLAGQAVTPGTAVDFADGTYTIDALMTVEFPYGATADNLMQTGTVFLDDVTVSVTQVDNH